MLSIFFKAHAFVLAWVTDDPMGQGYFTDYKNISFFIFSFGFCGGRLPCSNWY